MARRNSVASEAIRAFRMPENRTGRRGPTVPCRSPSPRREPEARAERRGADPPRVQIQRQPVEIDRAIPALIGMDADVAFGVDAEIAEAPAAHVVELLGVLDGPGGIRDRRLQVRSAPPEGKARRGATEAAAR